jgi:hypothetical protein
MPPSAPVGYPRIPLPNDYHRVVMVVPIVVVPMATMVMIIIRLRESGRREEHDQG